MFLGFVFVKKKKKNALSCLKAFFSSSFLTRVSFKSAYYLLTGELLKSMPKKHACVLEVKSYVRRHYCQML